MGIKRIFIISLLSLLFLIHTFADAPKNELLDTLPGLIEYDFNVSESKVLPGKSTEKAKGYNCSGNIIDNDKIGNLAIVSLLYQNGCYTDGKYNNNNYKVEHGVVTGSRSNEPVDAYRIYGPSHRASKFLASKHVVYYRFPQKEAYNIYSFDGKKIKKISHVHASEIVPGRFIKIKETVISNIDEPVTYLFAPQRQKISVYTGLARGIEGARILSASGFKIYKLSYKVTGVPYDNNTDNMDGPDSWGNVYSPTREFFPVKNRTGIGVVWQDKKNKSIYLTSIGENLKSYKIIKLKNSYRDILAAAASDESGHLYYLTIQDVKRHRNSSIRAAIYKATASGGAVKNRNLNTSKKGLNMVSFNNYVASMVYSAGRLGIIIGRTMHRSSDGLNHQGAIALVLNSKTLSVMKNLGQTSGHSLESMLISNSKGEFTGIDLGDNYPRGVHLHKFTEKFIHSRVVYTFKTKHGTKGVSPAKRRYPLYSGISRGGKRYYSWSNDNNTYTELGGVVEGDNSYTVVFIGEPDSNGRSLNNSRVGKHLNDARNIGLVKVISEFEKKKNNGNVVSDELVLTKGISEKGGFYTFGGKWADQRNTGVQWLTEYKNMKRSNVSRLKAVKVENEKILLLWEKWTPKNYVSTYAMLINESGMKLSDPVDIGSHVRLHRRDDPIVMGKRVFFVSGDKADKKLELIVFQF